MSFGIDLLPFLAHLDVLEVLLSPRTRFFKPISAHTIHRSFSLGPVQSLIMATMLRFLHGLSPSLSGVTNRAFYPLASLTFISIPLNVFSRSLPPMEANSTMDTDAYGKLTNSTSLSSSFSTAHAGER